MKRRILGVAALCFTACICIAGGTLCYLIVPQSFEQAAALEFHLDEAPPTVHTAHEPEILTQQTALAASLQAHGIVIDRPIDWSREQVIHFAGTASVDAHAHEPEILTQQTALAASLQAHGIVIDRPIDWSREQVIHFAGTASVDAQALHYGAYVLQSDGALREVLHGIVIDRPIDWSREQVIHFAGTASVDAQALHYGAYVLQSDGALREVLADYAVPETTGGFYAEIPSFHVALNAPTKLQCLGSGTMTREVGCSALVRDGWQLVRLHSTYYIRYPIDWNAIYRV